TLTTEFFPGDRAADADAPGLVMVFSVNRPAILAHRLTAEPVTIGRKLEAGVCLPLDSRMSRSHARVRLLEGRVEIVDLESHNGTFVDGTRITETVSRPLPRTPRIGDTVFIFVPHVEPFLSRAVELQNDVVIGPRLALV